MINNKSVNVLKVIKENYKDFNEIEINDTKLLDYFKINKADKSLIEALENR